MKIKSIGILALLTLLNQAFADPKDFYAKRAQNIKTVINKSSPVRVDWFNQIIDHSASYSPKFKQRYYYDTQYSYHPNDPIFIYLCGESTCKETALGGAIKEYAKRFHAKLIALEHRYYGKSIPTTDLSTNNLKYLSTEQAIADIYSFQKQIMSNANWKGKWVVFGGSYPGNLSAFYRLQHPDMVVGSIASSAPVEARENFSAYDAHVAKVAGSACLQKIQAAVAETDKAFGQPKKLKALKVKFGASKIKNNVDFQYLMADIAAIAVQYGMKKTFCQSLENSQDPITGYANFAKMIYKKWNISPADLTAQGATSIKKEDYLNGFGMRQWLYQSCTEYGYWQNASSNPQTRARSQHINLKYHQNICKRLFNIDKPAPIEQMNHRYYFPLQDSSTSNIFFTNGSTDPWMKLSLAKENHNTSNLNLNYTTIKGAAHCDDLHPTQKGESDALRYVRFQTTQLINQWLR